MLDKFTNKPNKPRTPTEITGLDFGAACIKAVKLKKTKDRVQLIACSELPLPSPGEPLQMDKSLLSHYCAICYEGDQSVIRVVSLPREEAERNNLPSIRKALNVNESFRCATSFIEKKADVKDPYYLGVGIPESDAAELLKHVASGPPAPVSLEISGLSALTAFWKQAGASDRSTCIALINIGEKQTVYSFYNQQKILLAAKFNLGGSALRKQIERDLGIKETLVREFITGESIDLSQTIKTVTAPFIRNFTISRDFIQRNHKTEVGHIYFSGEGAYAPLIKQLTAALAVSGGLWNPFLAVTDESEEQNITVALPDYPEHYAGAIGAALGGIKA